MIPQSVQEEIARAEAMDYLHRVALHYGQGLDRWRCEVIEYSSPIDGIIDFAEGEGVDLIVLCTHDGNASARLVKQCMARPIRRLTKTRVCVFGPRELAGVA